MISFNPFCNFSIKRTGNHCYPVAMVCFNKMYQSIAKTRRSIGKDADETFFVMTDADERER